MKIKSGKFSVMLPAALLLSLALSGCQSSPSGSENHKNQDETVLKPGQTCGANTAIAAAGTPDALYADMVACVKAQQFDRAVFLYALAGSYTWFDAQRVATQYARMAHGKYLGEALAQLSEKQVSQLWEHIRATLQDAKKQAKICEQVQLAGMPTHSTSYMRIDKSSGSEMLAGQQDWVSAVNNYLLCK